MEEVKLMANDMEEIENKSEILYNYLYGDTPGKIVLYSNILLTSVIGPILMSGIVVYEIFGGDSQKRTIVNRLLSGLLVNMAILGLIGGINRTARDCFGLLDYNLALFLRLLIIFFKNTAFVFYNLLTLFRYLFIVVWKRMRGVQDKFWFLVFCLSAYTISLWYIVVLLYNGFHPNGDLLINLAKNLEKNVTLYNNKSTTHDIR